MKMTLDEVRKHWEEAGRQFPTEGKVSPTTRDPFLGELEEDLILSAIHGRRKVLEIGCGDGLHTVKYAKRVEWLSGLDIAESLVELAAKRVSAMGTTNVDVSVGSVLDAVRLYGPRKFDCVISQRCLINLPEWKLQKEAILQIGKVLKPEGLLVITEGFREGLDNINRIRKKLSLEEIKTVRYNQNLVRKDFEKFVRSHFEITAVHDYGTYLFLSRVFHPLAVSPDAPKHDSRFNQVALQISRAVALPSLRKYSYNLLYLLTKH